MFEPDNGIPFISLSWAGMAGVLTGMNRAGVSVTINGAPTQLPRDIGTPVAFVAREILQEAHNLDEAVKILRAAKVFVSTLWLVGSRADGKFIVVEKTPDTTNVREPVSDSIVCPNHFETANLKDTALNTNYLAEATSVSREQRLLELLKQNDGAIDAAHSVNFLRDRDLPGGIFAGNGHRGSLNAFIATHAVVMDLTAGIFWAAAPPNGLGKFVAFDVNDFSRTPTELDVPADATLGGGEFERARSAHNFLDEARRALKAGDAKAALDFAKKAETLNPGFYQNSLWAGQALLKLSRQAEAAAAFEKALAAAPAFLGERRELEEGLRRARSAN
jgi:tetratricopeptide (TPR) repeat protein